jgi:hypothetical protein
MVPCFWNVFRLIQTTSLAASAVTSAVARGSVFRLKMVGEVR